MTNDLERVTLIATELGLLPEGELPKEPVEKFVDYQDMQEQLLEFEQAVLEKRDEEHDSLVGQLELEIMNLKEGIESYSFRLNKYREEIEQLKAELLVAPYVVYSNKIESLQAKLAMQDVALKDLYAQIQTFAVNFGEADFYTGDALKAINATQADVDNWMQGKKAEWKKGVLEEASEHPMFRTTEESASFGESLRVLAKERGGVR